MKIRHFAILGLLMLGFGCADAGTVSAPAGAPGSPATAAPSAVRLDLSGKGMEKIPMDVFDRTGLEVLDVSNNRLTGALPSQIQRLQHLRILDASENKMTGVPAEIGQLSRLEDLDLSNNDLTGLPSELGNLRNLRRLDLRGNHPSRQDLDGIRAKLPQTEILE